MSDVCPQSRQCGVIGYAHAGLSRCGQTHLNRMCSVDSLLMKRVDGCGMVILQPGVSTGTVLVCKQEFKTQSISKLKDVHVRKGTVNP